MTNPEWTTTTPYDFEASADGIYTAAISRMYGWITLGLVTTGAAAALAYRLGVLDNVGLIGYLVILGVALALLFALHLSVHRVPGPVAAALYLGFTAVEGVAISYIFGAYTYQTIVLAFGLTAGLFTAMSIIVHYQTGFVPPGANPALRAGRGSHRQRGQHFYRLRPVGMGRYAGGATHLSGAGSI